MRQQLNEVITHTVCDGLVDRRVKYFKLVSLHKQTMPGRGMTHREREGGGEGRAGVALKRNTRERGMSQPQTQTQTESENTI